MMNVRTETDSLGKIEVPINALYAAQTQRAVENFPVSGQRMPAAFIVALIRVKAAACQANLSLDLLPKDIAKAIGSACAKLLSDEELSTHFPVDVFQTGSGTSSNMNANEVIATLANELRRIEAADVHPNDHVNFGQSSNDVIPTVIQVSATQLIVEKLMPALKHIIAVTKEKADVDGNVCKTGRTHLMDAMPVTLAQTLNTWASQYGQHIHTLETSLSLLKKLPIGGTAVGTGINTHPQFASHFCTELSKDIDIDFAPAENKFVSISSQDAAVICSSALKAIAVTTMKVANDLRWMNSGPLAGLGEIALPSLQPGSSIMPGKVNPVIPESAAMVCAQVIGNDTAITVGGQSGNFELNVMLPMIAANLVSSIDLLSNTLVLLADKAIAGFTVNQDNMAQSLHRNPILVTALNPIIGYAKAAEIAKTAYAQQRPILEVALEMTDLSEQDLKEALDPIKLTKGGM